MGITTCINKPEWFDEEKEKFRKYIAKENLSKMKNDIDCADTSLFGFLQYCIRMECHILFEQGYTAYQISASLDLSYSNVLRWEGEYFEKFPEANNK